MSGRIRRAAGGLMIGAVAASGLAGPAAGQQILDGATADLVLGVLTEDRQTGLLKQDSAGDPLIEATIDTVRYQIFFYDCRSEPAAKVCGSLQFTASFPMRKGLTLERVNAYNTNARYVQSYLTQDEMLRLDMSVAITGGVTRANLLYYVKQWGRALVAFEEDVYADAPSAPGTPAR